MRLLPLLALTLMPLAASAVEDGTNIPIAPPQQPQVVDIVIPPPDADPVPGPGVKPLTSKAEKLSPRAVEVRLKDGSTLRGELKGNEPVTLKTSFGALKFPLEELQLVIHGDSGAETDAQHIAAAIADFKGSDADKRTSAERDLEDAGKDSLDALFALRSSATPELKPRIDDLLKRILIQSESSIVTKDCVRATKFGASGTLEIQKLSLSSKLGDLTLKISDVDSIRWLAHGDMKTVELDSALALREWTDTGVEAMVGEPLSINSSGNVVLFNSQVTPAGISNNQDQVFPFGAVVGKLGPDGEPFLIGEDKSWKPDSNQRLYLKIFVADDVLQNNVNNNNRSRGHFTVRIACGPRSKEISTTEGE
jgi:hypothetical protein